MKAKLIACSAALLLSSQALADVSAQATFGVGYGHYEYEYGSNPIFDFDYEYADIGLNFGISDFYANLNAMIPITEGESSDGGTYTFRREQYSFNLGYHITDRIAVFLGTNYASNEIDADHHDYGESYTDKLNEIGGHIGLAGKILAFKVGALTAKAGYSITEREINNSIKESGTGYVYGLGWVGFINKHFSYAINVDGYKYDYNGLDSQLLTAKATLGYLF